jgi:hypothetical protein
LGSVAAFAYPWRILAINETVFFDAANGHFDDAVSIFADDRLLGNNVCDVIADRFPNLLPMPQPIAGAAVAALPRRGVIRSKNGRQDVPRRDFRSINRG